jgi:predicted RNase H-like HicB family nuclease
MATIEEFLRANYPHLTLSFEYEEDGANGDGWFVRVNELNGCMSQGATLNEALSMIGEAIELWIETAYEDSKPVPAENTHYTLIFDGGASGNPGPAYGSYAIRENGGKWLPPRRRDFGIGTNNEAEWKALIEGLKELVYDVGFGPGDTLAITGDSQLVVKQLTGEYKVKEPRLRSLRDTVLQLLKDGGSIPVEFVWRPREHSVAVLGH